MPPKRKLRDDSPSDGSDGSDDNGPAATSNKRVARLVPRTRHISERVVKSKWTTLPEPVQDRVKELFRLTELPVLTRQMNEKKRIEAQSALSTVRKKYVYVGQTQLFMDNACVASGGVRIDGLT